MVTFLLNSNDWWAILTISLCMSLSLWDQPRSNMVSPSNCNSYHYHSRMSVSRVSTPPLALLVCVRIIVFCITLAIFFVA
jgi:hypothetical protein